MPATISIKELHATTGEIVRRAGASRIPLVITDRGEPVAVLARPDVLTPARPRRRTLLPEFRAMMLRAPVGNTSEDLDDVRGDR